MVFLGDDGGKRKRRMEPEALEPRAEGEAWCRLKLPLQKDSGGPGSPLQEALRVGMRRYDRLPQESPSAGKHGPQQAP